MASSARKQRKRTPQPAHQQTRPESGPTRWVIVGMLLVVVLFGAYRVFTAVKQRNIGSGTTTVTSAQSAPETPATPNVTGAKVEATAKVIGGAQKITINVTSVYGPNIVRLKAGVPAELTFSGGQGCTSSVHSQQLGFAEDLSSGPKTVKLKGLQPGTYQFSCGMDMVFGEIVVQ